MAGTYPEAWTETALVSICKTGGTYYQFAAITETVDLSEGDHPGESVGTVGGGGIWKQSRQEDGEITMEIYPINLDTTAGQGLFQEFYGGTWDTAAATGLLADSDYPAVGVMIPRDTFNVVVCWTNDAAHTTAEGEIDGTDSTALRFWAKKCRITSHKSEYTDGILKTTVTFKFPAIAKAGTDKSYGWESTLTANTNKLAAIGTS